MIDINSNQLPIAKSPIITADFTTMIAFAEWK